MTDWPEEARVAAVKAIDATGVLVTAPMAMRLATDILDAVAPILAGAQDSEALRAMHWLVNARYEVIAGSRKADGAGGFFAALEHLDLCEPEEFYGETLPEAIGRAYAWAVAKMREANGAGQDARVPGWMPTMTRSAGPEVNEP